MNGKPLSYGNRPSVTVREFEALEAMVDGSDINAVIEALSDICHGKADHVRTNWQDEPMAKAWEAMGRRLSRCY